MKFFKVLFLLVTVLIVSGCSFLTPGYIDVKPDLQELEEQKSSYSDVKDILGEPAYATFNFRETSMVYYYKTSLSKVDMALMRKGSYSRGCTGCAKIYIKFMHNKDIHAMDSPLYSISVNDPELKELYEKGQAKLCAKDYDEGLKFIQQAAKANYVEAEHTLGLMYINGDGVVRDYSKAFYWFTKASRANHTRALYDLGAMYKNGEYVEKNEEIAKQLYIMSANKGYVLAIKELIKIYEINGDVDKIKLWKKRLREKSKGV